LWQSQTHPVARLHKENAWVLFFSTFLGLFLEEIFSDANRRLFQFVFSFVTPFFCIATGWVFRVLALII
jgi:hypothetical protein